MQVLVAILGEVKKAYVIGHKQHKTEMKAMVPKTDTNNIVLLDDSGNPLGTRILVPIPASLRQKRTGEFAKILAIATKFV